MIRQIQNLGNRLLTIGIDKDVPAGEERYIRFTNVEAILTMAGVALYMVYSFYKGYFLLGALQGIDAALALLVLYLNYHHFHKAARVVFMYLLNSIILIDACFIGHSSGIHEFFYISYTIPFLLFSVRDYKYIVSGVLLAVFGFMAYPHLYPYYTAYNADVATQLNIHSINSCVIFVLFGMAVYMLAYYNFKTEIQLADSNTKLGDSNSKLEEQATELKRSNEDLEQFAYIISHDLKAPVRNISSFMNLLGKQFNESSPKGTKEFVEMSKQSADRLTKQIDDMLSYCRIDRNLPPAGPVDLNQMVKTIRIELNEKIQEKNAEIIVERELPVLADMHSSMMHHVFQNLIANAIKFNTRERAEVRINYTDENGVLTFSFADNGIGIAPAFKDKLFQMFKRLHTADQFEGTGIGLAVCKKIVNFYKGEIWFESEPEKGTTFFFTLPKHEAKAATHIGPHTELNQAA